jgi:hypothetical protein
MFVNLPENYQWSDSGYFLICPTLPGMSRLIKRFGVCNEEFSFPEKGVADNQL